MYGWVIWLGWTPLQSKGGPGGVLEPHLGGNFIKQKLLGTPNLVGVGHLFGPQIWIWKDLGPVWLSFKEIFKIKVVVKIPYGA